MVTTKTFQRNTAELCCLSRWSAFKTIIFYWKNMKKLMIKIWKQYKLCNGILKLVLFYFLYWEFLEKTWVCYEKKLVEEVDVRSLSIWHEDIIADSFVTDWWLLMFWWLYIYIYLCMVIILSSYVLSIYDVKKYNCYLLRFFFMYC